MKLIRCASVARAVIATLDAGARTFRRAAGRELPAGRAPHAFARSGRQVALCALVVGGPVALAADQLSACKPAETAVFANRIHVRCETPVDGRFPFFAVSTADPRQANRWMALIMGAELGDKYLDVTFDPTDTSGAAFGCAVEDCRNIKALLMMERVPDRCEMDNTQRGCSGFCAANGNNDPGCPGFCTSHDDMRCPGNCDRHPANPSCVADPCDGPNSSHLPQCNR